MHGAKPPWHDLILQMAVAHAGITKATTNMKEEALLNKMPEASRFGTQGSNNRTRAGGGCIQSLPWPRATPWGRCVGDRMLHVHCIIYIVHLNGTTQACILFVLTNRAPWPYMLLANS